MVKKKMVNRLNKWKVDSRPCHSWCYVPLTNPIQSYKPLKKHVMRCKSAHNLTAFFVKVLMNPRKAAARRDFKHQKRVEKRFIASWDEWKRYLIWISGMIRSAHPTTCIGWSNLSYPMTIQHQIGNRCPLYQIANRNVQRQLEYSSARAPIIHRELLNSGWDQGASLK